MSARQCNAKAVPWPNSVSALMAPPPTSSSTEAETSRIGRSVFSHEGIRRLFVCAFHRSRIFRHPTRTPTPQVQILRHPETGMNARNPSLSPHRQAVDDPRPFISTDSRCKRQHHPAARRPCRCRNSGAERPQPATGREHRPIRPGRTRLRSGPEGRTWPSGAKTMMGC